MGDHIPTMHDSNGSHSPPLLPAFQLKTRHRIVESSSCDLHLEPPTPESPSFPLPTTTSRRSSLAKYSVPEIPYSPLLSPPLSPEIYLKRRSPRQREATIPWDAECLEQEEEKRVMGRWAGWLADRREFLGLAFVSTLILVVGTMCVARLAVVTKRSGRLVADAFPILAIDGLQSFVDPGGIFYPEMEIDEPITLLKADKPPTNWAPEPLMPSDSSATTILPLITGRPHIAALLPTAAFSAELIAYIGNVSSMTETHDLDIQLIVSAPESEVVIIQQALAAEEMGSAAEVVGNGGIMGVYLGGLHYLSMLNIGEHHPETVVILPEMDPKVGVEGLMEEIAKLGRLDMAGIHCKAVGLMGARVNSSTVQASMLDSDEESAPQEEGDGGEHNVVALPVAFLLPPFVIGIDVLRDAEHGMTVDNGKQDGGYGVWVALGKMLTAKYGNGGLIVGAPDDFVGRYDLGGLQERLGTAMDAQLGSKALDSRRPYKDFYHSLRKADATDVLDDGGTSGSSRPDLGIVVVVLSKISQLEKFGNTICSLSAKGHIVYTVLHTTTSQSANHGRELFRNSPCHFHYTSLSEELVEEWYIGLGEVPDVVFVANSVVSEWVGGMVEDSLEERISTAVVHLPDDDMRAMDWVGGLEIQSLQHWHTPQIDLSIIVKSGTASLARLLRSLHKAAYFDDHINLFITLDQSADAICRTLVEEATWSHGTISVQNRLGHESSAYREVESWYPANDDSYVILLDSHMEVSPLFYAWAKMTVLAYRYGTNKAKARRLYGVSLENPRSFTSTEGSVIQFDGRKALEAAGRDADQPYILSVPSTGGAVYFPEHWKELHAYIAIRSSQSEEGVVPVIPTKDLIVSSRSPWKTYLSELAYLRGYTMLYPNFQYSHSFTRPKPTGQMFFDVKSTPQPKQLDLTAMTGREIPAWSSLTAVDLWLRVTTEADLVQQGIERHKEISGCPPLADDEGDLTHDAGELFCTGGLEHTE